MADPCGLLEALYKRPGFLLRRAHQISVALFLSETRDAGVTTTQYGVLTVLRHCEGLDQIDISKRVGLDRTTAAVVVRSLEQKRLVVRVPDRQDKRRKIIVLTARGERMVESLAEPAARVQQRALSVFTPEEAAEFLSMLQEIGRRFNEETRAPISGHEDAESGLLDGEDADSTPR